jgi:hypothetical protein
MSAATTLISDDVFDFDKEFNDDMTTYLTTALANMKEFAYLGFNADDCMRTLITIMRVKEIEPSDFVSDIISICSFYLTRGNKMLTTKTLTKTKENGAQIIKKLARRYCIRATAKQPDDFSVMRIAALFPNVCVALIRSDLCRPSAGVTIDGLPNWLCFPSSASVIPMKGHGSDYFRKYEEWEKAFHEVINAKKTNEEEKKFTSYATTVHTSIVATDDERKKIIEKCEKSYAADTGFALFSKVYVPLAIQKRKALQINEINSKFIRELLDHFEDHKVEKYTLDNYILHSK